MVHPSTYGELGTEWSWDGDTITKANSLASLERTDHEECLRLERLSPVVTKEAQY